MKNESEQKIVSALRSFGISPSPQRIAIYGFLRAHPIHPCAETIYQAMKKDLPTLSLTTVYNTLKLLSEKHAVQEVLIEDGELRFDADMRAHAHFKCERCGEVTDLFPKTGAPLLENPPALPPDFELHEIHLCMKGFCANCRSANSSGH